MHPRLTRHAPRTHTDFLGVSNSSPYSIGPHSHFHIWSRSRRLTVSFEECKHAHGVSHCFRRLDTNAREDRAAMDRPNRHAAVAGGARRSAAAADRSHGRPEQRQEFGARGSLRCALSAGHWAGHPLPDATHHETHSSWHRMEGNSGGAYPGSATLALWFVAVQGYGRLTWHLLFTRFSACVGSPLLRLSRWRGQRISPRSSSTSRRS